MGRALSRRGQRWHSEGMTGLDMGQAPRAEVGVIGGTGLYEFLADAEEVPVETPYGDPSAPVTVGTVAGRTVAFVPRHGRSPSPTAPTSGH